MNRVTTAVASSDADVVADQQLALRHAIECRPVLRQQMGSSAFAELLDIVTFLDDAPRVSSIWAVTLYPMVLNGLERECSHLRAAIARVRQVITANRPDCVRLTPEEQRMTANPFDTREERDGIA
jgi:hypothetical protein